MIDERWADRITEILREPNLLGTSVDRLLRAEGFEGSYPTYLRCSTMRGPVNQLAGAEHRAVRRGGSDTGSPGA